MRILIAVFFALCLISCTTNHDSQLSAGIWRSVLTMQGRELPFSLLVDGNNPDGYKAYLKNGSEKLPLDDVQVKGDSVTFGMLIFDAAIVARIDGDSLNGYFIKRYEKNYRLPFAAVRNQDWRFSKTDTTATGLPSFDGKFATTFTDEDDTVKAVALFNQKGNLVTGTFLTPSGDYRFLEGSVADSTLHLSTFDGNHTYLFSARRLNDSILIGDYWSGKTLHRRWIARRDPKASLPDADTLTHLKPGFDRLTFSFPDPDGKMVSTADEKYKGKALIVEIMGSWCPNCMDESKFLTQWYEQNNRDDVAIIGLAYERKPDFAYASSRVRNMKEKLGINYDILIAGVYDSTAAKTLPMLNAIVAYPTTIFVGKDGKVKKIHTGFSGPGTGVYFEAFKDYFKHTVDRLVVE